MPRLSKALENCVRFARWCRDNEVSPLDAAELVARARAAFKAGEHEANTGKSADRQRHKVTAQAAKIGFKTLWPGLWPLLQTANGRQNELPLSD